MKYLTKIEEWLRKLGKDRCLDNELHEWGKWKEIGRGKGETFIGGEVAICLQERKCKKCGEIDLYLART